MTACKGAYNTRQPTYECGREGGEVIAGTGHAALRGRRVDVDNLAAMTGPLAGRIRNIRHWRHVKTAAGGTTLKETQNTHGTHSN